MLVRTVCLENLFCFAVCYSLAHESQHLTRNEVGCGDLKTFQTESMHGGGEGVAGRRGGACEFSPRTAHLKLQAGLHTLGLSRVQAMFSQKKIDVLVLTSPSSDLAIVQPR
jgi:hypothetical protein